MVEVADESRDASQEAKGVTMEAMPCQKVRVSLYTSLDEFFGFCLLSNLRECCLAGKIDEAVEHLTKAIILKPTNLSSHLWYKRYDSKATNASHSALLVLILTPLQAIVDDLLTAHVAC